MYACVTVLRSAMIHLQQSHEVTGHAESRHGDYRCIIILVAYTQLGAYQGRLAFPGIKML